MSYFDEQPDGDPHGECASEIHRLEAQVAALTQERDQYSSCITRMRKGVLLTADCCRIWGGEAERARKMLEHYLAIPSDTNVLDTP